jgi:hypothetical protein
VQCGKVCLLDHLVGDREKGGRHGEAEHLRGLMIDNELELSFSFAKLASESPDRVATVPTPCRPDWKPAPEADFWAASVRAATFALPFLLLAAAPVHAQGPRERLIPPQPIPHVASTGAHPPKASSPPLPRPRAAPAVLSQTPVAPQKAQVLIND